MHNKSSLHFFSVCLCLSVWVCGLFRVVWFTQAPVTFEIPRPVILESIVNAVAHRDYRSNGFVQVIVFADRMEVWNPGELPPGLTPDLLREPHGPMPRNPLIAEPLYRVKYVEKAGTGTTDMIADCRKSGLPEPDFEQRGPYFVVTVWRDWLTNEVIGSLDLNDRQRSALTHLKTIGRIGNTEYQSLFGVAKRTAHRDLIDLVKKGVLEKIGTTGKGTAYVLWKGAIRAYYKPVGILLHPKSKGAFKPE